MCPLDEPRLRLLQRYAVRLACVDPSEGGNGLCGESDDKYKVCYLFSQSIKMVWNSTHESILMDIQEYSNQMFKEYHQAYWFFMRERKGYKIPVIVMNAVAGLLGLSAWGYFPHDTVQYLLIAVGVLNMIITILHSIAAYNKVDENADKAFEAYLGFRKLHDEIGVQLRLPRVDRQETGVEAVCGFGARFGALFEEAPVLPVIESSYLALVRSVQLKVESSEGSSIEEVVN